MWRHSGIGSEEKDARVMEIEPKAIESRAERKDKREEADHELADE